MPSRLGILEGARCAAGVDFDIVVSAGDPDWSGLLDLFARVLTVQSANPTPGKGRALAAFNRQTTDVSHLL